MPGYYDHATTPNIGFQPNGVTTSIETITPQTAERMLSSNTANRRLDMRRARELARDMRNGRWQMNGEPIRFSRTGRLLDGQHRLTACVIAQAPFTTLVIRGLDDETQLTVDTGKSRSMADVLTIDGETNTAMLAAVTRAVYLTHNLGLEATVTRNLKPTNTELNEFLNETPQLRSLAQAAQAFKSKSGKLLSPAVFASLWWVFAHIDNIAAEEFFAKLATGADLHEGDPILVLRSYIRRIHDSGMSTTKDGRRMILAVSVKAWNKWREGATIRQLRFSRDEKFPEAK